MLDGRGEEDRAAAVAAAREGVEDAHEEVEVDTAIMMDDSAILCGYPPGPANFTCNCGAVRPATGTECAVSLLEQHSRAPCTSGVSFGCYPGEPTRMWTRNCRGKFHCAGLRE